MDSGLRIANLEYFGNRFVKKRSIHPDLGIEYSQH